MAGQFVLRCVATNTRTTTCFFFRFLLRKLTFPTRFPALLNTFLIPLNSYSLPSFRITIKLPSNRIPLNVSTTTIRWSNFITTTSSRLSYFLTTKLWLSIKPFHKFRIPKMAQKLIALKAKNVHESTWTKPFIFWPCIAPKFGPRNLCKATIRNKRFLKSKRHFLRFEKWLHQGTNDILQTKCIIMLKKHGMLQVSKYGENSSQTVFLHLHSNS